MKQIQYEIHEKLPTVYDVALSIFSYSTQPESKNMTEVVQFPFLNCVKVSDQDQLVETFQKLYNDRLDKKTDTFVVSIHGMSVPELLTDVSREITDMCVSTAEALEVIWEGIWIFRWTRFTYNQYF